MEQKQKNIIYNLLCEYYDGELFKEIELDDVSSEIYMRLEERPSGILKALESLIIMEANPNDETHWTPLMMSVMNLDYYMTEYLINHGANPCFWYAREEDIAEQEMLGMEAKNYYLEDIDIRIIEGIDFSSEIVTENILNLAKIILQCEGIDSFHGYCIEADKGKREININALRVMY